VLALLHTVTLNICMSGKCGVVGGGFQEIFAKIEGRFRRRDLTIYFVFFVGSNIWINEKVVGKKRHKKGILTIEKYKKREKQERIPTHRSGELYQLLSNLFGCSRTYNLWLVYPHIETGCCHLGHRRC